MAINDSYIKRALSQIAHRIVTAALNAHLSRLIQNAWEEARVVGAQRAANNFWQQHGQTVIELLVSQPPCRFTNKVNQEIQLPLEAIEDYATESVERVLRRGILENILTNSKNGTEASYRLIGYFSASMRGAYSNEKAKGHLNDYDPVHNVLQLKDQNRAYDLQYSDLESRMPKQDQSVEAPELGDVYQALAGMKQRLDQVLAGPKTHQTYQDYLSLVKKLRSTSSEFLAVLQQGGWNSSQRYSSASLTPRQMVSEIIEWAKIPVLNLSLFLDKGRNFTSQQKLVGNSSLYDSAPDVRAKTALVNAAIQASQDAWAHMLASDKRQTLSQSEQLRAFMRHYIDQLKSSGYDKTQVQQIFTKMSEQYNSKGGLTVLQDQYSKLLNFIRINNLSDHANRQGYDLQTLTPEQREKLLESVSEEHSNINLPIHINTNRFDENGKSKGFAGKYYDPPDGRVDNKPFHRHVLNQDIDALSRGENPIYSRAYDNEGRPYWQAGRGQKVEPQVATPFRRKVRKPTIDFTQAPAPAASVIPVAPVAPQARRHFERSQTPPANPKPRPISNHPDREVRLRENQLRYQELQRASHSAAQWVRTARLADRLGLHEVVDASERIIALALE